MSQNIQVSIDLGTTNSEIAFFNQGTVEIIKNVFGDEFTPSVFGIDRADKTIVGKKPYERLFKHSSNEEVKNNKAEVKRLMGTSETVEFVRTKQQMSAEQISAEIIKQLKEDLHRKYPDSDSRGVVITIPAHFSTLQAEATKRAGELAGFEYIVLLQEPIAAAISYGFNNTENQNWLVYDLGGGTFDVALISSKGGNLSVLGHSGDNFLGGKDFDWSIVERIILPELNKSFSLRELSRENPTYRSLFAKLKYLAEMAKVCLSQTDETTIEVEGVGEDDEGKEIYLSINLSREVFENLMRPFIDRTIELARQTIEESGTDSGSINKIVLVGGPTQIPYVRTRLEREFRVPVDFSVDPLTVVAKGACIFASSQRLPAEMVQNERKTEADQEVTLHFDSLTSETEESLSGVFPALKENQEEYFVQIQSESGYFCGDKIRLRNGKFFESVLLEQNKSNLYWIYLFDSSGNSIPVIPDSFSITHGLSISGAPIPHSIGVAVAKKDIKRGFSLSEVFEPFFPKSSILPLKGSKTYRTVKPISKGDTENALPIKVYEGESEIPNRNQLICDLKITGENLLYDLPEETEVEITIEVNQSREVKVSAFLPTVDLLLDARATIHAESLDVSEMEEGLNAQSTRLSHLEANCSEQEKEKLHQKVSAISASLANSSLDEDEKRKANKHLKDLKVDLDQLEAEKELPHLKAEFESNIEETAKIIEEIGQDSEKSEHLHQLETLKQEGAKAIELQDKFLLNRVNEQILELGARSLYSNPLVWVHRFKEFAEGNHSFTDQSEAEHFIKRGERAIELGDVDEIKRCTKNLILLLPSEEQQEVQNSMSGIMR